jgi:hypothetical protein
MLGAGCGGGDEGIDTGPSATEGTANPTVMKSSAVQADSLRAAIETRNGAGIAAAAIGLSAAATAAVQPKGATTQATTQLGIQNEIAAIMQAQTTMTTGSVSCTDTGCTFDKYGVSGSNSFTISGSLTTTTDAASGAKHVLWSLTGSGSFSNQETGTATSLRFTYNWKGDMVVSASSVDGAAGATWAGSGNVNGQSFTYNFGTYIKFNTVTFADHAATGGSIFAKAWITASAGGRSSQQAYQATYVVGS